MPGFALNYLRSARAFLNHDLAPTDARARALHHPEMLIADVLCAHGPQVPGVGLEGSLPPPARQGADARARTPHHSQLHVVSGVRANHGRACGRATGPASVFGKDIRVAAVEKVTDELSEARHAILVGRAGPAVADKQDVDLWRLDDRAAVIDEVAEGAGVAKSGHVGWLAWATGRDEIPTYFRSRSYTHRRPHPRVMSS